LSDWLRPYCSRCFESRVDTMSLVTLELEPSFTVQTDGVFVSALILSVCAGIEAWVSCNRGAFLLLHCFETDIPAVQSLGKFFSFSLIYENKGAVSADIKKIQWPFETITRHTGCKKPIQLFQFQWNLARQSLSFHLITS
jgi:hypothetical protein